MVSWIVKSKETGKVVFETYRKGLIEKINLEKYEVIPIKDYLASLNKGK